MFYWFYGFYWFSEKLKLTVECRLGEMSLGWVKLKIFFRDMEKCLEGLVKLVMTLYRFREMSGGFGDTTVMTSYRLGNAWRDC